MDLSTHSPSPLGTLAQAGPWPHSLYPKFLKTFKVHPKDKTKSHTTWKQEKGTGLALAAEGGLLLTARVVTLKETEVRDAEDSEPRPSTV